MGFPKYDGNIHPDEWINDIQKYLEFKYNTNDNDYYLNAISLVDPTIKLPTEINNIENLRNALKEDISFTVFKNTNERMLQSLKYIPEREGGKTSNFISNFRKLCYNAEINDIEEQKKYLYRSLPMKHFDYVSNEFYKKMKNVNSINELIKEFEDIILEESKLIKNGSIVALKHVATGKYLTSINNLNYTTGSKGQLVFIGSPEPYPNSLWKIKFNKELATYADTFITLQHIKSEKFIGVNNNHNNYYGRFDYYDSPVTKHTEVSCNGNSYRLLDWKLNHSKSENHQGYLKSGDNINLYIKKNDNDEFLRSHDVQFTIGNDAFQEMICHNERLGGNDEHFFICTFFSGVLS
ncbi:hypothetical protein C1645_806736 [Glomus cerebriforme]|uniref:MIR domain-containing protein n=1 Tax=Glomus cerebriforme TaxID=658196 RepID=A0A397SQZ1_9GLOM|nr:hypothetical protein C1645_806736 [Glomus cerebriforme]